EESFEPVAAPEAGGLPEEDGQPAGQPDPGEEPAPADEFEGADGVAEHQPVVPRPRAPVGSFQLVGVEDALRLLVAEVAEEAVARGEVVSTAGEYGVVTGQAG